MSIDTPPQETYRDASVLVTGASGFIGTHLCRQLRQKGARVTGVYLNNAPKGVDADWVRVDLREPEAVKHLVQDMRPEFIFHLASAVEGQRGLEAVQPTFENNLTSTVNLLTAAEQSQCCKRLVITNSLEEPDRGDPNAVPSSPYAASKFAASAYARMFHSLYGFPVVIARVFMVYGPEQKDLKKLVPYTILKALNGEDPELSSGLRNIDWVYVGDVVDGLLQLGRKTGLEGSTVDIGSGHFFSIKETVEEILRQIDPNLEGRFGTIADRPMEQERLANSIQTRDKTSWQARVTMQEGLAETIAWYRAYRDSFTNQPAKSR